MLDSVHIKYSLLLKLVTIPDQNFVYLGYEKVDIHSYWNILIINLTSVHILALVAFFAVILSQLPILCFIMEQKSNLENSVP